MRIRTFITIAAAIIVIAVIVGCTTGVMMQVQRTPNWNTAGIKRLAVMPFEHGGGRVTGRFGRSGRELKEVSQHLTTTATTRLKETGHFTLVSSSEIARLRKGGERIENHVDALLTGKVLSVETKDSSFMGQRRNPDTKEMEEVMIFTREVTLSISYSLELARDGSLTGIATRNGTARDQQYDQAYLKTPARLAQEIDVLNTLVRDLVPYTTIETRQLMTEKSKDKTLKAKMKNALTQVKGRNYRSALTAYIKIYEEHKNAAAIYNAAVMHEALGEITEAINLMSEAANDTGNPKFNYEIARLNKRLSEQKTVETEYRQTGGMIDRTIAHAVSEAQKVLPQNARVWLVSNKTHEPELASAAADALISSFIKQGITVVDRENTELIERELVWQMSGSVNDGDLLRAGNITGANTIVTVAISGTGSMRRLQLRILDAETGVPLLQSDTDSRWGL